MQRIVDRVTVMVMLCAILVLGAMGLTVFAVNSYFHASSAQQLTLNRTTTQTGIDTLLCWQVKNSAIRVTGLSHADLKRYQREEVANLDACLKITGYIVDPRVTDH